MRVHGAWQSSFASKMLLHVMSFWNPGESWHAMCVTMSPFACFSKLSKVIKTRSCWSWMRDTPTKMSMVSTEAVMLSTSFGPKCRSFKMQVDFRFSAKVALAFRFLPFRTFRAFQRCAKSHLQLLSRVAKELQHPQLWGVTGTATWKSCSIERIRLWSL